MSSPAPSAEPRERRVDVGGLELHAFEWRADLRGSRPSIVLTHATGFHARCWDRVIAELGERHVVAVDQRGHGRSDKRVIEHWNVFGRDLARFAQVMELEQATAVGHSMGGHATAHAAALQPERFAHLLLIDPVIASPDSYAEGGWALPANEPHPTSKRRNTFDSPEAMFARFEHRSPYSLFEPTVLRDYCRYGLLPAPEGTGYVLACPPAIEASVYMTSRTHAAIYDHVRRVQQPVRILRAPPPTDRTVMDFTSSPTWPGLVSEFPHAQERVVIELTHFIPMQSPPLVARAIEELESSGA